MDVFGKKALRQEIKELKQQLAETETALDETRETLQRYKEKFQKAETEKQDAYRERKELAQRLQNLQQSREDSVENTETVLSGRELNPIIAGLEDTEFMTAHAYTAYLPDNTTVLADDRDEIVFFDPFTTGIAIYPPVPVDEQQVHARTFHLEQLQQLVSGPYCYVHLSSDGGCVAVIQDHDITEHEIVSDGTQIDTVVDTVTSLSNESYDILAAGDQDVVNALTDRIDTHVHRTTSKVPGISRTSDVEQAFMSAFTFECRRLTDTDIDQLRDTVF